MTYHIRKIIFNSFRWNYEFIFSVLKKNKLAILAERTTQVLKFLMGWFADMNITFFRGPPMLKHKQQKYLLFFLKKTNKQVMNLFPEVSTLPSLVVMSCENVVLVT